MLCLLTFFLLPLALCTCLFAGYPVCYDPYPTRVIYVSDPPYHPEARPAPRPAAGAKVNP